MSSFDSTDNIMHAVSEKDIKNTSKSDNIIKRNVVKNLMIIGFVWLLMFSAFMGLTFLQSSINAEDGLGTIGLAVVYGSLCISALFLSSPLIARFGTKWTMSFALLGYALYVILNVYPSFYTIIPASVVIGTSAAPLWSSAAVHITELSKVKYSTETTKKKQGDTAAVYFGIFFMFSSSSVLFGNMISSLSLREVIAESNVTTILRCGAKYCPTDTNSTDNIQRPSMEKFYIMMGCFMACAVSAYLLLTIFLDPISRTSDDKETEETTKPIGCLAYVSAIGKNTFRQLINTKQLLLVGLTTYVGLTQSFSQAEYTKAFVACSNGIPMVGFVMMCYGGSSLLSSLIFGKIAGIIGRLPVLYLNILNHFWIQIYFHFWEIDSTVTIFLYVFAGLLGTSDAIWNSQLNALYSNIFGSSETAFSTYRLWESVGYIIGFATGNVLCTATKLFMLSGLLGIGSVCLIVLSVMIRYNEKREQRRISTQSK